MCSYRAEISNYDYPGASNFRGTDMSFRGNQRQAGVDRDSPVSDESSVEGESQENGYDYDHEAPFAIEPARNNNGERGGVLIGFGPRNESDPVSSTLKLARVVCPNRDTVPTLEVRTREGSSMRDEQQEESSSMDGNKDRVPNEITEIIDEYRRWRGLPDSIIINRLVTMLIIALLMMQRRNEPTDQ